MFKTVGVCLLGLISCLPLSAAASRPVRHYSSSRVRRAKASRSRVRKKSASHKTRRRGKKGRITRRASAK